ncbi:MAG: nucleotidyltransferase domain-containing protein [Candidatus Margulisbacteria bacterium]|nr:nucleotidyltransferase domain-containing protein [Candidatus Margulisiibacteriota bacterium]
MLKLSPEMDKNIQVLKKFFDNQKEVILAFLFGSQFSGRKKENSDFDIAVWFKDEPSIDQVNTLWGELIKLLHKEVDLVVLNSARPTVAWAALRGQKLLIRDFRLFLKLFLDVSREAEDIQDFTLGLWNLKKRYAKI